MNKIDFDVKNYWIFRLNYFLTNKNIYAKKNCAEQPTPVPEPAESFAVDFLNARGIEIKKAISEMGFVFRHSGPDGEGKVFFEGQRADGTTIRISIEQGAGYTAPAEIANKEKKAN
ncbi:hypothetical protein COX69_00080 [Candidatus Falkowbacteria bacterium CG_4_10_14_0_2_um_filter_48_10]|uniref:Uncharacterized protein n=1 Tax=Candidatus Falkowbacteria bacterium CG23_combo_of_CG06-09_8_20_14_all_49_15 TaxID=1974572 RepID=A0A2G9ZLQ6_9BACT|nr:MAG: hypothetical protein COX22_00880 [Candidatus Falkowbacteria bacterium CG23_combo_of_CG06-09_8_20_14_all_49_15]PJA09469.1 MAG: hypothetical protein COX69_00080 [Candidatus Falkowbacteria bacterium CG_4_10_14_0_2_um_filter_48_10]